MARGRLGSLALLVLHHMTRGAWGLVIRRILEASARTLPLLAVLGIPVLLGMHELYPWSRPEACARSPAPAEALVPERTVLLHPAAFYFGSFSFLAWWLSGLSQRQDETGDPELFHRMQFIAAPGVLFFALVASFMGIDFLMTLDPHWFSSIYGLYFVISQALAALTFTVLVFVWLGERRRCRR